MTLSINYFGDLSLLLANDHERVLIKKEFVKKLMDSNILVSVDEIKKSNGTKESSYIMMMHFDNKYFNIRIDPSLRNYYNVAYRRTFVKSDTKFFEHSFDGLASNIRYADNGKVIKSYSFNGKRDRESFSELEYHINKNIRIYRYKSPDYCIATVKEYVNNIVSYMNVDINDDGKTSFKQVNFNMLRKQLAFLKSYNYSDLLYSNPFTVVQKNEIKTYVLNNLHNEDLFS